LGIDPYGLFGKSRLSQHFEYWGAIAKLVRRSGYWPQNYGMVPSLDFLSLINLLGVVQGIFLSITFFTVRSGNRLANRLLAWMMLFLALVVADVVLCYSGYIIYAPFLVNSTESLIFLHGPISYFYARALSQPNFRLRRRHWPHAIPFVVHFIYRFPFHLQSNAHKLDDVFDALHRPDFRDIPAKTILWYPEYEFNGDVLDWLIFFSLSFYAYLTFRVIADYARLQNTSWWRTRNPDINWLGRVWIYFSVMLFMFVFFSVTFQQDLGDIYIVTAFSLVLYFMSFHIITQSRLLEYGNDAPSMEKETRKKYEKSLLNPEASEESLRNLLTYMVTERPYLNSNLTLPELARKLNLSTHHLSQIINERLNQNFFDFINGYRIEEIKRKLADPTQAHLKIEEIAFDTGFNSKSAFHTAFKKVTQTTPSQYRKAATEVGS
jgi:AraC-like DNA-binding protein